MGRWADREDDSERLPEGFQRIGYDADTQMYTFRDAHGTLYESEPGNRYGALHRQGEAPLLSNPEVAANNAQLEKSNRESVKMMLPFALLVIVFLLLMFRFLGSGSGADGGREQVHCAEGAMEVRVEKGDSCWEIAGKHGVGVEELLGLEGNEGMDCDALKPGQGLCVPV